MLQKVCRLKHRNSDLLEINTHKIENLKLEINEKDQELENLQTTNAILTDPKIVSYSEGKYTNKIRETIMHLITECGVSQTKVLYRRSFTTSQVIHVLEADYQVPE